MSTEVTTIRGVRQTYGTREPGGAIGVVKTEGISNELTVDFDSVSLSDDAFATVVIPAGSIPVAAYVEITEAFVMGGTSPTILVGTSGSEATNGCVISEALGEAIGAADITATLAGTWDNAGLAAATTVGVALGGTSPTITSVGKGRVTVVYKKVAA